MKTTIDRAGRIVVPKSMRDRLGLDAGAEVEIVEDGSGLRLEPVARGRIIEVEGHLIIDGTVPIDDEMIRELRLGDQR